MGRIILLRTLSRLLYQMDIVMRSGEKGLEAGNESATMQLSRVLTFAPKFLSEVT